LIAPISGVLVFRTPAGIWIEAGQEIADIVDPLSDRVETVCAGTSGVLYARHRTRFATAGMEVARIAGSKPLRSGSLLSA
jgi:predicted deacylase